MRLIVWEVTDELNGHRFALDARRLMNDTTGLNAASSPALSPGAACSQQNGHNASRDGSMPIITTVSSHATSARMHIGHTHTHTPHSHQMHTCVYGVPIWTSKTKDRAVCHLPTHVRRRSNFRVRSPTSSDGLRSKSEGRQRWPPGVLTSRDVGETGWRKIAESRASSVRSLRRTPSSTMRSKAETSHGCCAHNSRNSSKSSTPSPSVSAAANSACSSSCVGAAEADPRATLAPLPSGWGARAPVSWTAPTNALRSSPVKPSQAQSSQVKLSQAKPSQAKPSQAKPSQAKPSLTKPSLTRPNLNSANELAHRQPATPVLVMLDKGQFEALRIRPLGASDPLATVYELDAVARLRRVESNRIESSRVESTRVGSSRVGSSRVTSRVSGAFPSASVRAEGGGRVCWRW